MKSRIALLLVLNLLHIVVASPTRAQETPPVIVQHPTNRLANLGGSITMSVTAMGSTPFSYKWQKDGAAVNRGTNRLLNLMNLSNENAGAYTVVVANAFGSVTSNPALLTLQGLPASIYQAPTNTVACPGVGAVMSVGAAGSPPLRYQWFFNGAAVPDGNSFNLAVHGTNGVVSEYLVVVANDFGAATSQVARVTLGPRILQQPVSQTVLAGSNVLFSVVAQACPGTRYQWVWNGINVTNGTNSTLYYAHPTKDYEGDIKVVVSDTHGSVTSSVVWLEVVELSPAIVVQPWDILEPSGVEAQFSVVASGAPPPAYQWRFNSVDLPGKTNSFLKVPLLGENQGGYSVVVNNSLGSVTSRTASLTLAPIPPVFDINGQPGSVLVCPGWTVNPILRVYLSSPGLFPHSLFFQWRKDGVNVDGATNASLVLTPSPSDFGDYTVVVTNYFGAITSAVATVSTGPLILRQPGAITVADDGDVAWLDAVVQSCTNVLFQWQREGVDVPGATQSYLNFDPATVEDSGDYTLLIRHYSGTLTSAVARLEVVQRPPELNSDTLEDQEIHAGEYAYFYLSDYDLGAPRGGIQWLFNGRPIPGETNDYLTFMASEPWQQGRYSVVLSNSVASVTSQTGRLILLFYPPFFDYEPDDVEVRDGAEAYFDAEASAAPPPSYQWLRDGQPIPRQTNEYLDVIASGPNALAGYSVVASNLLGAITSRVATITVLRYPPGFVSQPMDKLVQAGEYVSFVGSVTGAPPPFFQWFLDGKLVNGATNRSLGFVAGFSNQIGGYHVVAINDLGSVTSRVARLDIVFAPPQFMLQPEGASITEGGFFMLSYRLSNNVPVFAQWQRNGVDIPGATNWLFTRRTATTDHSGDYQVVVWNEVGRATSQIARIEVRVAGPLDRWTWRRPLPQGNTLDTVAYGNGRHVAAGEAGGVAISTNGMDWFDAHRPGVSRQRDSVVFGNGSFVASDGLYLQVSTNGLDWVDQELGAYVASSVAFGNGRFVADINSPGVAISTNGFDWEIQEVFPPIEIYGMKYAGGLFATFSDSIDFPGFSALYTSTDGVTWIERNAPAIDPLGAFAHGSGKFVAIPSYYAEYFVISTNGIDWEDAWLPEMRSGTQLRLAWGNGVWVLAGGGTFQADTSIEYSTDAIHWIPVPGFGRYQMRDVIFDGERFVAVGAYGSIATSTNGVDWVIINPGSGLNLRSIVRANGWFITVGNDGKILASRDGRDWMARDSGTIQNLRGVTWFRDQFIVVGGEDDWNGSEILSSNDGSSWQSSSVTGSLYSVTHNHERAVVVGNSGAILTSDDGMTWNKILHNHIPGPGDEIPSTAQDLNAVTWGGGLFVAVGKDGTVLTSTDGLTWQSSGPGGKKNLHGIAYGNGVYVAIANDGRYFVSTDAMSWLGGILEPRRDLSDVIFAGGRFMAVGDSGLAFTSENGTNWIRRPTVCDNDLRSVIYAEGSYYAVGNNETILQTAQTDASLRITRLPGATDVQLDIFGESGRPYRLQGSMVLAGWTDLLSFTAGTELTRYTDASPGALPWRFYRVISP